MPALAVSAVGLDRPGIIAGVAERLAAHGATVTDSRMAILRGHFAMASSRPSRARSRVPGRTCAISRRAWRAISIDCCGFEARAIQHEIDHLDGLLFLDRVQSVEADVFRRKRR